MSNDVDLLYHQCGEAVSEAYVKVTGKNISLEKVDSRQSTLNKFLIDFVDKPEEVVTLVYFVIYSGQEARPVGNAIIQFEAEGKKLLSEVERSKLAEVGNMLIGTYLARYSNLSGKNLRASIQPVFQLTREEAGELLRSQLLQWDLMQPVNLIQVNLMGGQSPKLWVFILQGSSEKSSPNEVNTSPGKIFADKFSKLGKGWITLLQIPITQAMETNIEAILKLQDLGYEGIYVTLSKDYLELSKMFKAKGVDMSKLMFIDGISQMYGTDEVKTDKVVYVSGPLSVDDIAEQVPKMAAQLKGEKKFVFLDSITTVLLYNSLERTLQFSRFLTQSLKRMQVAGVVVSVSKGFANQSFIKELTKISSEVINLQ